MAQTDFLGWGAAALTLLTFYCQDMRRLRLSALGANVAFVSYALAAGLTPVLALHLTLIPLNMLRLIRTREKQQPTATLRSLVDPGTTKPPGKTLPGNRIDQEHRAARITMGGCTSSLRRYRARPRRAADAGL